MAQGSATDLAQNLAWHTVLELTRYRTLQSAKFCNGSFAQPCAAQGSATAQLQKLAERTVPVELESGRRRNMKVNAVDIKTIVLRVPKLVESNRHPPR